MSERSETIPLRRRVTIADVASAVGLARTTVSDILNRQAASRYSPETRHRVEQAVIELGYNPSRAAQQLARGRSGRVGLLLTRDFSNPFFAHVADSVERAIRSRGYQLQLAVTGDHRNQGVESVKRLMGEDVEAMLIGPFYETLDLQLFREHLEKHIPIVVFGGLFDCPFDLVAIDHDLGRQQSLDHLLALGHRRIGYLCAPPSRATDGQAQLSFSILDLIRSHGVLDESSVLWHVDTGNLESIASSVRTFARRFVETPREARPTAVICHNDQVALVALSVFAELGISVPGDLSIVGFDNLPEARYLVPAITTVELNTEAQMSAAVAQLLARLVGEGDAAPDAGKPARIIVKPQLIVRASTAASRLSTSTVHNPSSIP